MIYIDVGSATIKVYEKKKHIKLLETKSFDFKKDFSPNLGLTEASERDLIDYLGNIKNKHESINIKVFATALFRKLSDASKRELIDKIFQETGLYFNIISQELEGFYLEQALSAKYVSDAPILLVNIGGGSTELVIKQKYETVNRINLDLGVGTIYKQFPYINDNVSKHSIEEVVKYIKTKLPNSPVSIPVAIYSGGELTYMKITGYKLCPNKLFKDDSHPMMISLQDFQSRNSEIFNSVQIEELEKLMPNDPLWMHGARACSAIAQAICEKFKVETIIPSDSNTIHGIVSLLNTCIIP